MCMNHVALALPCGQRKGAPAPALGLADHAQAGEWWGGRYVSRHPGATCLPRSRARGLAADPACPDFHYGAREFGSACDATQRRALTRPGLLEPMQALRWGGAALARSCLCSMGRRPLAIVTKAPGLLGAELGGRRVACFGSHGLVRSNVPGRMMRGLRGEPAPRARDPPRLASPRSRGAVRPGFSAHHDTRRAGCMACSSGASCPSGRWLW